MSIRGTATSRRPQSQTCPPFTVDHLPEIVRINELAPDVRLDKTGIAALREGVSELAFSLPPLYASRLQSLLGQF